jgi:putative membrane protein
VHAHSAAVAGWSDVILVALAGFAVALYVGGVVSARRRGRSWPALRTACWVGGVACAAAPLLSPAAAALHTSFSAHMWGHLVAGMVAPLLLVLAAPVTLALRALALTPARRLSRVLRSAPLRFLAAPVTALLLSAGGLWLIYLTPVHVASQEVPLVGVLVHLHLVAAGYLFTAAVIGTDPRPHRSPRALLAAVLIASAASHSVLAKYLYAYPPAGIPAPEAEAGAQLMYYGGAWVEAAVIVVFCAQWYRATAPRTGLPPVASAGPA